MFYKEMNNKEDLLQSRSLYTKENGNIIGRVDYFQRDNVIVLTSLEIVDDFQRQGYGRQMVIDLFNKFPSAETMTGIALPVTTAFWKRINVHFISKGTGSFKEFTLDRKIALSTIKCLD